MTSPSLSTLPPPPDDASGWPWTEAPDPLPDTRKDGRPWPRISIVTPSYNQADFLEETLRSVLLQGYPSLEYVVVDGGSDDGSVDIIEKYAPWLDRWESTPDRGQSHALNKGFEWVDGTIYAWLNSDDIYYPGALAAVVRGFDREPDAGAVVGEGDRVHLDGTVFHTASPDALGYEAFLEWEANHFMQPACFFRREAWAAAGPLREDLYYCMDLDLWLRMTEAGVRFVRVDERLASAKSHLGAKTSVEAPHMKAEIGLLLQQHGATDQARAVLMEIAQDLAEAERRLHNLNNDTAYRMLVRLKNVAKRLLGRR